MIIGAGAVGSWLGGMLRLGGADVTLVARGDHADAMERHGLRLIQSGAPDSAVGSEHVFPRVTRTIEEAMAGGRHFDVAAITVKSYDTDPVADEISRLREGGIGVLASFQNGLGNEGRLATGTAGAPAGPPVGRPVLAGSVTTAAWLRAPGVVASSRKGGVALGPEPTDVGTGLADALERAGVDVRRCDDPTAMKWSKVLLNMLGAGSCAVLDRPPADVFCDGRVFRIELAAWREALRVMEALGLRPKPLPGYPVPTFVRATRWLPDPWLFPLLSGRLAAGRGDRLPGIAADLRAGRRRTEVDQLLGAVASTGLALGLTVPVNTALTELVAAIAAGSVRRERFAGRPAALERAVRRRMRGAPTILDDERSTVARGPSWT